MDETTPRTDAMIQLAVRRRKAAILVLAAMLLAGCRGGENSAMNDVPSKIRPAYPALDSPAVLAVMFYPRRSSSSSVPVWAENVQVPVDPSVTLGCRFYRSSLPSAPMLLYFHGNGEIVADYDDIAREYTARDMHLFLATYRGYGWSGGSPTASLMLADAESLYRFLCSLRQERGLNGPLWIMGRSLGSASAIELAAAHSEEIGGLIIESGFADTLPLARTLGLSWAEERMTEDEGFGNVGKIERVTAPILLLHGGRDSLIPSWHAEKLRERGGAATKELVMLPEAGHNTMLSSGGVRYFEALQRFIADNSRKGMH